MTPGGTFLSAMHSGWLSRARRIPLGAALLAILLTCGGDGSKSACPASWTFDAEGRVQCYASDSYLDALRASVGSGAYGFARKVTGDCSLGGPGCLNTACESRLVPDLEIIAYHAADVIQLITSCLDGFELADGAVVVGSATTNADGVYVLPLPEGNYALTTIDPVDGCPHRAGSAQVSTEEPLGRVLFVFDHASN